MGGQIGGGNHLSPVVSLRASQSLLSPLTALHSLSSSFLLRCSTESLYLSFYFLALSSKKKSFDKVKAYTCHAFRTTLRPTGRRKNEEGRGRVRCLIHVVFTSFTRDSGRCVPHPPRFLLLLQSYSVISSLLSERDSHWDYQIHFRLFGQST